MKITILKKNRINDRLEYVFIPYNSNKEIENQIEHRLEMLLHMAL
jgi:hypothetical protein